MKFATLYALVLVSVADAAYDLDGDGVDDIIIDDTEDCEGRECKQNEEDAWMNEETYQDDAYEEWNFEDFENQKVFKMLAAMNANKTSDADGIDELGVFKVDVYKAGVYDSNLFYKDLSDSTETYDAGWRKRFDDGAQEYTFEASEDCFLRMYLEEIDTNSNSSCTVDVSCHDTPFSYAPCWIQGAWDTDNSDEYGHGYYNLMFSIEEKYEMEEWGTCDVWEACQVVAFGTGFYCREY